MEFNETKNIINDVINDVYKGTFKTGDKFFSQRNLEDKYKVSRGVIREAVQVLKLANIINVIPGKGTFIAEINLGKLINPLAIKLNINNINQKTFLELYSLRVLLEIWALNNLFQSYDIEKVRELEIIIKNMNYYHETREDLYILEDSKFHTTIVNFSNN